MPLIDQREVNEDVGVRDFHESRDAGGGCTMRAVDGAARSRDGENFGEISALGVCRGAEQVIFGQLVMTQDTGDAAATSVVSS